MPPSVTSPRSHPWQGCGSDTTFHCLQAVPQEPSARRAVAGPGLGQQQEEHFGEPSSLKDQRSAWLSCSPRSVHHQELRCQEAWSRGQEGVQIKAPKARDSPLPPGVVHVSEFQSVSGKHSSLQRCEAELLPLKAHLGLSAHRPATGSVAGG